MFEKEGFVKIEKDMIK